VSGAPRKATIKNAIVLTDVQRTAITLCVSAFWGRGISCPRLLDIKPRHGFVSRISNDGFGREQCMAWLKVGCSDSAEVSVDRMGRPHLVATWAARGTSVHPVLVPIRSTNDGVIYVDDVIPKGVWPGRAG
jgi:hypothetical protein